MNFLYLTLLLAILQLHNASPSSSSSFSTTQDQFDPGDISMGNSQQRPRVAKPITDNDKNTDMPTDTRQVDPTTLPEDPDQFDEPPGNRTTVQNQMQTQMPPRINCSSRSQCSFYEDFSRFQEERWTAADGYTNGPPFDSWWSRNRVWIDQNNRKLRLSLTHQANLGKRYASGQLQTKNWHGYGCYEVRMKPVRQRGVVTTFFTYTGFYDAAEGFENTHNEIDIEFIWRQRSKRFVMQTNYFTGGRGQHEHFIVLPFAAEEAYHNYGFRWTRNSIEWYADGEKVYTATTNLPKASVAPHKIMMNFWPVSPAAAGWAGLFSFTPGRVATYAGVRFTRGEKCRIRNSFPNQ